MPDADSRTAAPPPVKAPPLDKGELPTEPVLKAGFGSGVASLVALLVAFNVPLSSAQQLAIVGVVATLAPVVSALLTRRKVWSAESVRLLLEWAATPGDDSEGGVR